jgi:hypothetical protein
MSQSQGLVRAAGLGLAAAFLFGGLWTLSLGVMSGLSQVDCATLSETECALASELRRDELRLYLPEGGALVMLSVAVFLGLRKLEKKDKTP